MVVLVVVVFGICQFQDLNNFPQTLIQNLKQQIQHQRISQEEHDKNTKWVTFSY